MAPAVRHPSTINMSTYELSIEPALVAEAQRRVSLEGRTFPTVLVSWESQMLGQTWITTLVMDYTLPLPPLEQGAEFNEVRLAAYTGEVPTKFFYFGTELSADASRLAPEMENLISPAKTYQEYRLTPESSVVPYLELINTTPRIYGNGPQDYYSPPIKVERFDAGRGVHLIADAFPEVVANLPRVPSDLLIDPARGFWKGGRYIGTKLMAITRLGEVVGLRRKAGRLDREVLPPEVVRRDPRQDVRDAWVAIDLGTSTTVVAIGTKYSRDLIRIGSHEPVRRPRDYETPSEVTFENLAPVLKAWTDRVILPLTEWGDVYVGCAAKERRSAVGHQSALRTKATVGSLADIAARLHSGEAISVCGVSDPSNVVPLQPPAPPIIDEEGIAPDDPFDPLELFGYYIGLHVNTRQKGLHLRYAVGMPTGWDDDRRTQVLAQIRRGIMRSLPAGMVDYADLAALQVVDAGPNVLSFAAYAFRVFAIAPRPAESIPFVSVDAGASETAVLCGYFRNGSSEEVGAGYQRVVEHVQPSVLADFGGERLLHDMAYKVYASSGSSMRNNNIPFWPPAGAAPLAGHEDRLCNSIDARANVTLLKDAVRNILEVAGPAPLPDTVALVDGSGTIRDARVMIDRAALNEWLRGQLSSLASGISKAIGEGFQQVTRAEPPYHEMHIFLGGRLAMHPFLHERLNAILPNGVHIHRFREPDETNLAAPTVKLSTALGILALRFQPLAPAAVSDDRDKFSYWVGRAKRGGFYRVLDGDVGYDVWRELGPCTRPDVPVLFLPANSGIADPPADHPAIRRVVCQLGYDAVGYRVYVRATSPQRLEVSSGPPGGRPDEDGVCWEVSLEACRAQAVQR